MQLPIPYPKLCRRLGAIALVLNGSIMLGWSLRFYLIVSGNWATVLFLFCMGYGFQVLLWWWWYTQYQSLFPTTGELIFRQSFLIIGFGGLIRGALM